MLCNTSSSSFTSFCIAHLPLGQEAARDGAHTARAVHSLASQSGDLQPFPGEMPTWPAMLCTVTDFPEVAETHLQDCSSPIESDCNYHTRAKVMVWEGDLTDRGRNR